MVQMIRKSVLIFLIGVFCMTSQGYAQTNQADAPSGAKRHLATIIFAGLGGAVLGLSTLSFYGRPQDNLANIAIGFAVGAIAGTVYVTYQAASKPDEFYQGSGKSRPDYEVTNLRSDADIKHAKDLDPTIIPPLSVTIPF